MVSVQQPAWDDEPLDKEVQFCQFVQYLYEEEPCRFQFKITSATMKLFVYYNNRTFDVFDDLLAEMDANMEDFDLPNRGLGGFFVR